MKDTGTPEDIIHANKLVLDSIGTTNSFLIDVDSKIEGDIIIGKNTEISDDSIVVGPTIIGKNCKIGPSARIGPNASIGNYCLLKKCSIENSIVMDNCTINSKIDLSNSIIAQGSEIEDNPKKQFLLGERSKIRI